MLLIAQQPSGDPLELLPQPTLAPIQVHVDGAVINPGMYSLLPGARVADAITAAGGYSDDAVGHVVNPARQISDGEMIVIPSIDEQLAIPESRAGSELVIDSPVNINTATPEQLQRLPGLGPVKAAAIIDYRQQHGPFQSIEDLKEVPGIGDGIIEDIKNWIVFY